MPATAASNAITSTMKVSINMTDVKPDILTREQIEALAKQRYFTDATYIPMISRTEVRALIATALAGIEARELVKAVRRLVSNIEDEPERWPLDPSCNECTKGLTPLTHDKGLCALHWMLRALDPAEVVAKGRE